MKITIKYLLNILYYILIVNLALQFGFLFCLLIVDILNLDFGFDGTRDYLNVWYLFTLYLIRIIKYFMSK